LYGVEVKLADVAAAIDRVIARGDFNDYCKQADEASEFVCSMLDYNDPWKKLRKK